MTTQHVPQPVASRRKQPNRKYRIASFALPAVFTLFVAVPALRADMIPPVQIQSLFQEEQDVRIRITVPNPARLTAGNVNSIVRTAASEEHVVAEAVSLTEEDAEAVMPACKPYSFSETIDTDVFCAEFPEECLSCLNSTEDVCIGLDCDTCEPVGDYFFPGGSSYYRQHHKLDCDSDGETECMGTCDSHSYDFWDYCVPPGTVEYKLFSDGLLRDTKTIDVIESQGPACVPDKDTNDDTAEEVDTADVVPAEDTADEVPTNEAADGNGAGCTVLPAAAGPGLFRLIMQLL